MSQLIDENFPNATSEIGSATPSINIIPPTDEKINTFDEKNSKPLNDEDPPIADNNEKHTQDELRSTLEAKVSNVVNVLKINQKEKISSTVTPQQAFDDMRDLSINSIPENTEKVNTLDEKNSKQLNDEDPPIADNNEKHSQNELRATLEAKVADVVSVLKISQKEKILPTVTPQNTFDDIPKDLSINSITENFEKVNTSDEKNP